MKQLLTKDPIWYIADGYETFSQVFFKTDDPDKIGETFIK